MTDRSLRTAGALDALRWDDRGLIPVVAQEATTGEVLMMAWANREALARTLDEGVVHYWSRSRGELWKKGATSGNLQHLVSLHADCDRDTVLARVTSAGPACHTGEPTCFGALPARPAVTDVAEAGTAGSAGTPRAAAAGPEAAADGPEAAAEGTAEGPEGTADGPEAAEAGTVQAPGAGSARLDTLWAVLEARDRARPEGSWTTRLLSDENLRLKKLGEETVELVTALVRGDARAPEEAADLLYHLMVALKGAGHEWTAVLDELDRRRGQEQTRSG